MSVIIYDIQRDQIYFWNNSISAVSIIILGVLFVGLIFLYTELKRYAKAISLAKHVSPEQVWEVKRGMGVILIATTFIVVLNSLIFFHAIGLRDSALRRFNRGEFCRTCGYVEDFVPLSSSGKNHETFRVGEVWFSLSEYDQSRAGYNTTMHNGGLLAPGMYVEISFIPVESQNTSLPSNRVVAESILQIKKLR